MMVTTMSPMAEGSANRVDTVKRTLGGLETANEIDTAFYYDFSAIAINAVR